MGKLIYAAITSLDGYIADTAGNFDWSTPDAEVHAFVNDLERPIGTYLLGRRLYDVMKVWDTFYGQDGLPKEMEDYAAIWHQAQKIIYSTTLSEPGAANTRIEPTFDPDSIRRLKAEATTDLSVGGAELAGQALKAGLVDEIHLLMSPVMVGGGKRALPDGASTSLELLEQRRFGNGVVHLHYGVKVD
ncbi:dihydrofolate reductase family protein [Arthrobacter glacialis]|uniref:Deaminase n=1 Tax=Arthrobacter glacialis TaxID=1664 RepID=A0A2S3ZZ74_ARTGL|nr:dihydrofolate reductase family protein [Arthrobacter glacialis]POH57363.1 deaminase [Arthrobacter glacialis]POH74329.1 deaminase [Arthrobacter glacialis]